jgi:hypothetical protein
VGRLRDTRTNQSHALEGYTTVGRTAQSQIAIGDDRVSIEHACLRWRGSSWAVRDLASTNGTWLNGNRIEPGVDVTLSAGDALAFGERQLSWQLEDGRAPEPMVAPTAGGEPCVLGEGVITIPDADTMLASIFRSPDGSWTLESADRVRAINPGETIEVGGSLWRFSCPNEWQATAKTQQVRLVQESTLHFEVSSDEEHVNLVVENEGMTIPMGRLSAFYLLLTLARIRNQEAQQHSTNEAGWTHREDLATMLGCGEQQLNVWIFRIRERFAGKDFLDYASIIERRDGTGQVRIGVQRNVIRDGR